MKLFFITICILICINSCININQANKSILLDKPWKFKAGDSSDYAKPDFNDSSWPLIDDTQAFNELGLSKYVGMAWYRYKVIIPSAIKNTKDIKKLEFFMGLVDGCDQFYFNGQLIGSNNVMNDTTFISSGPQRDVTRKYEISTNNNLIQWDQENTIAVRAFNQKGDGGMTSSIFIRPSKLNLSTNFKLSSLWKFKTGDSIDYSKESYNDLNWSSIYLGKAWEGQGFNHYDGFAWYRTSISLPESLKKSAVSEKSIMRLVVGKVDDLDQVFLNGSLIGENCKDMPVGSAAKNTFKDSPGMAGVSRIYDLDVNDSRIKWGKTNVIAIRVFDVGGDGGGMDKPYITMVKPEDEIQVDLSQLYNINRKNVLDTIAVVCNKNNFERFIGTVKYRATLQKNQTLVERTIKVSIKPNDSIKIPISIPYTTDWVSLKFMIDDESSSNIFYNEKKLPFVLK